MALVVAFALVVVRLWYLQGIQGEHFLELSKNNRIREREVTAPRGMILDRKGRILVDSFPRYDVTVTPEDVESVDETVAYLSVLLQMDPAQVRDRIRKQQSRPFDAALIKEDVSREELAAVVTHSSDLPGVEVNVRALRHYLFGPLLSSLLGYVGRLGKEDLQRHVNDGYGPGDLIGVLGIERRLEPELHGSNGTRQLVVDSQGRELSTLGEDPPSPGLNVVLTLDAEVQNRAEQAMGDESGSVVALDVNTGDVLAWVSKPTFDPNQFSHGMHAADWEKLNTDKLKPMLNRPIQGTFPPGSTFKIVMALAALEEGVMRPEREVYCPGGLNFGGRFFRCWRHGGHGTVSLHRALVESCDTYFYEAGIELGVDRIAKWANAFGLGFPTGIEIQTRGGRPLESPGLIPSSAWKRARFKSDWYPGETLSVAIGQGYVTVTPLQQAVMASVIANGGTRYQPHFVRYLQSFDGRIDRQFEPVVESRFEAHPQYLQAVQSGLLGVVSEPHGTGEKARIPGVPVAGKTGTAQVRGMRPGENEDKVDKQYRDHAWFVCYAPADHPEIAVAVLVEHGGHGGAAAAPVAKAVIEAYLESRREPDTVPVPRVTPLHDRPLVQIAENAATGAAGGTAPAPPQAGAEAARAAAHPIEHAPVRTPRGPVTAPATPPRPVRRGQHAAIDPVGGQPRSMVVLAQPDGKVD